MRSLNVVATGLIAVEAGYIDRSMVCAFLGASAEKRTPASHRDGLEPVAEDGVVRQSRQADLFEDTGHLGEEIDSLAVGLPEFNPQSMEGEHRPCGEPADWVSTIDGLNGHAAQSGLLEFARTVSPETIALIHGPEYAQGHLAAHLAKNVESMTQATRSRMLTPIAVSRDIDVDTPALTSEHFDTNDLSMPEQIEAMQEQLSAMSEDLAAARNDTSPSEAEIRRIVRDEYGNQ